MEASTSKCQPTCSNHDVRLKAQGIIDFLSAALISKGFTPHTNPPVSVTEREFHKDGDTFILHYVSRSGKMIIYLENMSSNVSGRTTVNFGSLLPTGGVNDQMLGEILGQFNDEVMRGIEKPSNLKRKRSSSNKTSGSSDSSSSLISPDFGVDQATQTSPLPSSLTSANTSSSSSSSSSLRTPQSVAANFGPLNYSWSSTDGSSAAATPPEWELQKSRTESENSSSEPSR